MASDNFIVRIYRRDRPDHLVGQVEDVAHGCKHPFQSMEKLWSILAGERSSQKTSHPGNKTQSGRNSHEGN